VLSETTTREFIDIFFLDQEPGPSILSRLAKAINAMTPTELLKVSSLQKFFFHEEINEEASPKKFLKRFARVIEPNCQDHLVSAFNRTHILKYYEQHKALCLNF
jgi:hypothetical protein